ncbi:MAG: hypothetical protein C3F11_05745 [Methylocystaceae bacterium]|nr:MAG: hypothetical protein C3F11_05745 [Methylocystaceae bacterium]
MKIEAPDDAKGLWQGAGRVNHRLGETETERVRPLLGSGGKPAESHSAARREKHVRQRTSTAGIGSYNDFDDAALERARP